jgi:hypothetical protein
MPRAPAPLQIEIAVKQLKQAIDAVERREIDVEQASWTELEKSIIKLLGGAFRLERPEHQAIALGVSGLLAAHLHQQQGAFWFPNREALEGAAIGFPDALMVLAPFGAAVDALSRGNLALLGEMEKEIGRSISQVRFSAAQAGVTKLTAADYQRLFDPGFIQFVAINTAKAKESWDRTPPQLAREIRDALGRMPGSISADVRKQLETQLTGVLDRLQPQNKLSSQSERVSRLSELIAHLFASTEVSGAAPEELWTEVILPILLIGVPQRFPPLEQTDLAAFRQGADPLLLYVDIVPHQHSAPEDGFLGLFAADELEPLGQSTVRDGMPRLLKLKRERLEPLLNAFDPAKVTQSVEAFSTQLQQQAGSPSGAPPRSALLQNALALLSDLKRVVTAASGNANALGVRQLTEAEALTDAALDRLRKSLQGPRIILSA